jgi:uncharacterized protein YciI
MFYVTIIGHGPNWVAGKSVYEQDRSVIQAHLESMRRRFDDGALLLGGPFDRSGGIAVWRADDAAHARELIDADPAVIADVMSYDLFELTAYFDRFTGHAAEGDVSDLALAATAVGTGPGGSRHTANRTEP